MLLCILSYENTCNRRVFSSLCRIHVFLLKCSANSAPLPPWIFLQNRHCSLIQQFLIKTGFENADSQLSFFQVVNVYATRKSWLPCLLNENETPTHHKLLLSLFSESCNFKRWNWNTIWPRSGKQIEGKWRDMHQMLSENKWDCGKANWFVNQWRCRNGMNPWPTEMNFL